MGANNVLISRTLRNNLLPFKVVGFFPGLVTVYSIRGMMPWYWWIFVDVGPTFLLRVRWKSFTQRTYPLLCPDQVVDRLVNKATFCTGWLTEMYRKLMLNLPSRQLINSCSLLIYWVLYTPHQDTYPAESSTSAVIISCAHSIYIFVICAKPDKNWTHLHIIRHFVIIAWLSSRYQHLSWFSNDCK